MKKKILAILVAAILTGGMLIASAEAVSLPVHVEGTVFGGKAGDSIAAELNFDTRWLTEGDNTAYNPQLASFAALISADSYFRTKDLERGTQNRVLLDGMDAAEYSWTALLTAAGFTDAQYIESYKVKAYDGDGNDSATMAMGYLCADDCDIYAIAIRGSFSAQEWLSAFDPGDAGEDYAAYTGAHPEWNDARRFKGVGVGAERAKEFIDEFIAAHDDPDRANCVLITGHSRGAMLANMIGADLEKDPDVKSFTYTFNTMPVTNDPDAGAYQTVFNIYDVNDFYCDVLPFGGERFCRYGRDLTADVAASGEIRAAIAELKGRDDFTGLNAEEMAEYREMFGQRFADRASLYVPEVMTETFATEAEAQARVEECRTLIGADAGLALETFCHVDDAAANADGTYSVTLHFCGGALLWGYAKTLAYGDAAYAAFNTLFRGDELACRIADFLAEHAEEIAGGHLLINTYALIGFVE